MRHVIAFLISGLLFSPANAQSFSGNNLYESCRGGSSAQLLCIGYVKGVIDGVRGHLFYERLATRERDLSMQEFESALAEIKKLSRFCTPESGNIEQYSDIVMARLERSPEIRHLPASFLIIDTLSKTFPCK